MSQIFTDAAAWEEPPTEYTDITEPTAENILPQISQIYTDIYSHRIHGTHRTFCLHLCKSVKSVGVFFSVINFSHAALMRLPQISRNTQNRLAEDILPQIARIHTDIYIT